MTNETKAFLTELMDWKDLEGIAIIIHSSKSSDPFSSCSYDLKLFEDISMGAVISVVEKAYQQKVIETTKQLKEIGKQLEEAEKKLEEKIKEAQSMK